MLSCFFPKFDPHTIGKKFPVLSLLLICEQTNNKGKCQRPCHKISHPSMSKKGIQIIPQSAGSSQ